MNYAQIVTVFIVLTCSDIAHRTKDIDAHTELLYVF